MIIQNRTISVALTCTQGQTSEKAYKNVTNSFEVTIIGVVWRAGGRLPPPNQNATNDKNVVKKP